MTLATIFKAYFIIIFNKLFYYLFIISYSLSMNLQPFFLITVPGQVDLFLFKQEQGKIN